MTIIENNFEEEVTSYKGICIVDFWAKWCGPCQIFKETFNNVEKEFKKVKFCEIDVDSNHKTVKKLGVLSIPTIIKFKDGKEIKRITGLISYDKLKEFIN